MSVFTILILLVLAAYGNAATTFATTAVTPTTVMYREVSYIDDVELYHINGIWQCDKLTCPTGTFGCRILRNNDAQFKENLLRINICYNRQLEATKTGAWYEEMVKVRNVVIDVNSYDGSRTLGSTSFNCSSQRVVGSVAAPEWKGVQKVTRQLIESIFPCIGLPILNQSIEFTGDKMEEVVLLN